MRELEAGLARREQDREIVENRRVELLEAERQNVARDCTPRNRAEWPGASERGEVGKWPATIRGNGLCFSEQLLQK